MNKFWRFLGRISAEIYLKMDYFGRKSPKSPSAGGFAPRLPRLHGWGIRPQTLVQVKWRENVQNSTAIEITGW